jgi:hypothetical protein
MQVLEEIIKLLSEGYYPEILEVTKKLDGGWTVSYNRNVSKLYLRKANKAVSVPEGWEWFVLSYYNLIKTAKESRIKVFISYSHKDFELAYKIWWALNKAGITMYIAELNPEPGKSLFDKIKRLIYDSDIVIVLYTQNAYYSPYVNQELGLAADSDKYIIPIVEERVELKGALEGMEYIKLDRYNLINTLTSIADAIRSFLEKKRNQKQALGFLILLGALGLIAASIGKG